MKFMPRYPIYIPSRDRWSRNRALTAKTLYRDRVPFRLVVRPGEEHAYRSHWITQGMERVELLVLPSEDFNLMRTRNWIRDHAEAEGHARHWQLDDNLIEFRRLWKGRRIPCNAGVALRVCEDLSDRYENVGISGLNYQMFVPAETPVPAYLNCHVYSATLVNHAMPYRWRLAYNDDTDICLQALTHGWCTLLLNAFMANKLRTMVLGGGNTLDKGAEVSYMTKDERDEAKRRKRHGSDTKGRFDMARILERQWPGGLVTTRRRFGRYQHSVDWGKFAQDPKLILRADVDLNELPDHDEYGLKLRAVKRVQSRELKRLLEESRVLDT